MRASLALAAAVLSACTSPTPRSRLEGMGVEDRVRWEVLQEALRPLPVTGVCVSVAQQVLSAHAAVQGRACGSALEDINGATEDPSPDLLRELGWAACGSGARQQVRVGPVCRLPGVRPRLQVTVSDGAEFPTIYRCTLERQAEVWGNTQCYIALQS